MQFKEECSLKISNTAQSLHLTSTASVIGLLLHSIEQYFRSNTLQGRPYLSKYSSDSPIFRIFIGQ